MKEKETKKKLNVGDVNQTHREQKNKKKQTQKQEM